MITDRTVFILGAGASKPYGYPTGSELREKICNNFTNQDSYFIHNDTYKQSQLMLAQKFANLFREAGANTSIDLFMKRNDKTQFTNIGKIAILFFILEAEYASKFDEDMDKEKRGKDWYAPLLNKMMRTLTTYDSYKKFGDNAVTFITFNYDRSLEYYVHKCFKSNFKSAPEEYLQKIGGEIIKIHHVYGKIADLPWQNPDGYFQNYKPHRFADYIEDMIKNIQTIYEMTKEVKEDIRSSIVKAKQIFFLGFGYAKENLEAIGIPEVLKGGSRARKIYGTAQGLPENRLKEITNMFAAYTSLKSIHIENTDCLSLLNKHLL